MVIDPEKAVTGRRAAAPPGRAEQPVPSIGRSRGGDVDAAFKNADVVVSERIVQQRLIPNAMEPRGALAQWSGAPGS